MEVSKAPGRHVLVAPIYAFGALILIALECAVAGGIVSAVRSTVASRDIFYLLGPLLLFATLGLWFSSRRAIATLAIDGDVLRISNGLGATQIVLDAKAPPTRVAITTKPDERLEGPVIEENNAATKSIGVMMRVFFFFTVGPAYSTRGGAEDFVVVSVTGAQPPRRALLPNVYAWNREGFAALKLWLAAHSMTVETDESFAWEDDRIRRRGVMAVVALSFGLLVLLGAGLFAFST